MLPQVSDASVMYWYRALKHKPTHSHSSLHCSLFLCAAPKMEQADSPIPLALGALLVVAASIVIVSQSPEAVTDTATVTVAAPAKSQLLAPAPPKVICSPPNPFNKRILSTLILISMIMIVRVQGLVRTHLRRVGLTLRVPFSKMWINQSGHPNSCLLICGPTLFWHILCLCLCLIFSPWIL